MGPTMLEYDAEQAINIPWAMQMQAISIEEPGRLVQTLTGAILGCGGWVLSRGADDTGTVSMLFEFERRACVDIYSLLIAAGLDGTTGARPADGHRRVQDRVDGAGTKAPRPQAAA